MAPLRPDYFDQHSDPIDRRIATGLHKLGLAMKHETWSLAQEAGVSPTQGQILATLSLEGRLSGSELAERIGLTLPTVSESVRVLVDKGLVEKQPDPRHPRASLVELTAAGRGLAARVRTWPDFLASAAGSLSAPEQGAFLSGLTKMIRSLQEEGRIPTNRMCVSCVHFRPNAHAGPRPHHCAFVDAPMAVHHLRLECSEHEEASPAVRAASWTRFLDGKGE
jgi:DNA-binding MarR family transcriptional regulator